MYIIKRHLANNIHFKPEDIVKGMFFITVTLKPSYYGKKARVQLKQSIGALHTLIRANALKYVWSAELTTSGNVHYHVCGALEGKYAKDVIIDTTKCHKILGNTKINTEVISECTRTYNYMVKDVDKTHHVINNGKEVLEVNGKWTRAEHKTIPKKFISCFKLIDHGVEDSETEQIIEYNRIFIK